MKDEIVLTFSIGCLFLIGFALGFAVASCGCVPEPPKPVRSSGSNLIYYSPNLPPEPYPWRTNQ